MTRRTQTSIKRIIIFRLKLLPLFVNKICLPMKMNIPERIKSLCEAMSQHEINAYIIPSSDPHLSEYPADHWKSRAWISGFTGSAGTVVITAHKAGLWTDSRYFLQAAQQLEGSGIELYKMGIEGTPTIIEFLVKELERGEKVGFDGAIYSVADARALAIQLEKRGIELLTTPDLIGPLWTDRPPIPAQPLFVLPDELSGASVEEKLNQVNNLSHQEGADGLVLTALDEIAWMFNLRGTDVNYNPVGIAYAYISEEESVLFTLPEKLTEEVTDHLRKAGVVIADYSRIEAYLSKLPSGRTIFVDKRKTNSNLFYAIPRTCRIIDGTTPVCRLKAIKNETEIKGFHEAVVRDGVALTRFHKWLEEQIADPTATVTEISAAQKLTALRAEQSLYIMDSFATICGYAEHGAIVHYSATPESDATLRPEGLLLIDSGAQYLDGTTDITRTIALGEPTEQMRKDFTRVLKGTISLAKCKFPAGTRGSQLDILARKALWDCGLNYLHGTGHGIGHCLNVHEGPQSIRMEENSTVLKPGMVTSDEPGLYRAGEYGIRIENMILTREDSKTEFGTFLGFETLTLCYIDTSLIIVPMLSVRERAWLNKYHQMVYEKLAPHLNDEEKAWLKMKTAEI